ncbi:unnamed protein product [Lupinus luteus]|uniref:Uncharacterized protein n=1 Tax=Lupinus luteus TaxID=3873 RepID=A0AAV1XPC8_LUPLU
MYRVCMAAIVAIAQGHIDPSHKWKTAFNPIHQNMTRLFSARGLLNLRPDLAGAVTGDSPGVENIQRQVMYMNCWVHGLVAMEDVVAIKAVGKWQRSLQRRWVGWRMVVGWGRDRKR